GVRNMGWMSTVAFTTDNRLLSWTTTGQAVTVWDVRAEKRLTPAGGHETALTGLTFTDGGRGLHTMSADGVILRWDVASAAEKHRYHLRDEESVRYGGGGRVLSSTVSPDGKHLLTSDHSGSTLWELATGREICSFPGAYSPYGMTAAFSADGGRLVMGGRDRR